MSEKNDDESEVESDDDDDDEWRQLRIEHSRLSDSMYYHIGKACLTQENALGKTVSRTFLFGLNEIVSNFLCSRVVGDVQHFARLARRATVRPDDVILYARHNPKLEAQLKCVANTHKTSK